MYGPLNWFRRGRTTNSTTAPEHRTTAEERRLSIMVADLEDKLEKSRNANRDLYAHIRYLEKRLAVEPAQHAAPIILKHIKEQSTSEQAVAALLQEVANMQR